METVEFMAAHDGNAPHVFVLLDEFVMNGQAAQAGPFTIPEAQAMVMNLVDAIERAQGLGTL